MQINRSIILHRSVQIFFEEDKEERLNKSVHRAADEHHHLERSAFIYIWSSSYQCHQEQEDLQVGEDRLQAAHRVLRLWQLKVHVDLKNKKYEVNVDNKTSLWSIDQYKIKTIQYVTYMARETWWKIERCWKTSDLESAEERDSDEEVGDDEGGQIVGLLWTSFNRCSRWQKSTAMCYWQRNIIHISSWQQKIVQQCVTWPCISVM